MKEIKVSFTISIPLKQTDIHWLEEELLRKREEVFIGVMKKIMEGVEKGAIKSNQLCQDCGVTLVSNGSETKKVKTLLGTLQIRRARLRCQRCGKDIYPLD